MLIKRVKAYLLLLLASMILLGTIPAQFTYASTAMPPTVYQAESASLSGTAKIATDHTGYTGSGFVAGYDNSSTAQTTFTVNVAASGNYNIDLRYGAGKVSGWPNDRTVGLVVNGVSQGNVTLPGTGDWETWSDDVRTVSLNAGTNTITYTDLTSGDNSDSINLDKLSVGDSTTIPVNATAYQAEDATLSGTAKVATDHTGYTGSGFVAGYDNSSTAQTMFTVTVGTSGDFNIALRYSAGQVSGWPNDRTVGLVVNGVSQGSVTLPGTGDWESWSDDVRTVILNAGTNTITYTDLTSGDNSDSINLDKLSIWKNVSNPVIYAIKFEQSLYTTSESGSVQTKVNAVYTNETITDVTANSTFNSSDSSIATVSASGLISGVSPGTATITAQYNGNSATVTVTVNPDPTVTVDFANATRQVDRGMFGYILTSNYDVPDSRMTLLGPIMNRESIPVQNFMAVGDGDPAQYQYEESVLARSLEAYKRATDNGLKWYFILGMHPSWTVPNNNPWGGDPTNPAWFKQYIKDVLQYYKDNGAKIDFANLTNEQWTGTTTTYNNVWNALREVYPEEIPALGPSGVGFGTYQSSQDWLPYASQNKLSIEGTTWHNDWASQSFDSLSKLKSWNDTVKGWQAQYPEANGKNRIYEENNSFTTDQANWARDMANVINSGLTQTIKGVIQNYNWNGMSDLLQTNKTQQNPGYRTPMWWVYYMFSQLSGEIVSATTDDSSTAFTAVASKDRNESKIIFVNNGTAGNKRIVLNNQPYSGQNIRIDLYKITSTENDGLVYQSGITPSSTDNLTFTVNNVGANESWMAVLKKIAAPPSFFHQMAPDDGEVATATPSLTWTAAKDAASYNLKVSVNKNLSSPVINQTGIAGTSYNVGTALTTGQKYYWRVTAVNSNGSTPVSNNAVYSFIVGANTGVPAQFGPYLPSTNFTNESTTPKFMWSKAYNATSYRLVVSTNSDLSNPVINQSGITSLMDTPQFGTQTAGYYQPTTALANDTKYYWMVYAANANGERPMNGPVQYFTTKPASSAPTSFSLTAPANGATAISTRAVLSWQQPKNAFFYKLEVSPSADMSSPVLVRDRMIYNKYTFEPNLLSPNTTYYWRVTAYTKDLANSTADASGIYSFTTEAVASSPLLYAEQAGNGKVKLWFQTSNGATSYKIKYGTQPGIYTNTITGVTASPYEVTGLTNGTNYYFAVVAVNASGDSSIWNERTATPTYRTSTAQVYEAEYETLLGGTIVMSDHTQYTGTGFVAGYDRSGTMSTKIKVTVPGAGSYSLVSRYSAGPVGTASINRTVGLYVNGTKVKDIVFNGTGNWETWAEELESLSLVAGINTIEFKGELANQDDCINLDNISVGQ